MDALWPTIIGAALVLVALIDVFLTVLHSRAGTGFLAPRLNRLMWRGFVGAGHAAGRHRGSVLALAGPAILVGTALFWLLLLWGGFALVAWPMLGTAVQATSAPTPTDSWAALYYAGYALTTLGTGDIVPRTDAARVLMVVQALVGFSVLTLTLTYFVSVYSALIRRNTLAQSLHHMSRGTGQPTLLLAGLFATQSASSVEARWETIGVRTLDLLESHHAYPILHYFRYPDARYAMARIALLVLEPLALLRSGAVEGASAVAGSAAAEMAWGAGRDLLRQTGGALLADDPRAAVDGHERERFDARCRQLEDQGLTVASDRNAAYERYRQLRNEWLPAAQAFSHNMDFEWSRIDIGPTDRDAPS